MVVSGGVSGRVVGGGGFLTATLTLSVTFARLFVARQT